MLRYVKHLFAEKGSPFLAGLCFPQAWMYVISSGALCDTSLFQIAFHAGMLLCLFVLVVSNRSRNDKDACAPCMPRIADICSAVLLTGVTVVGFWGEGWPPFSHAVFGAAAGVGVGLCFSSWFSLLCRFPVRDAFCYVLLGFSLGALGCLGLCAISFVSGVAMLAVGCILPVLSSVALGRCRHASDNKALAPDVGCSGGGKTDARLDGDELPVRRQVVVLCLQIAVYAIIFGNGFIFSILQTFISTSSDIIAIKLLNYTLRALLPFALFVWMVVDSAGKGGLYRPLFNASMLILAFVLLAAWFVAGMESIVAYGMVSLARNLVLMLLFLSCIKLASLTKRRPPFVFGIGRGIYELSVLAGIVGYTYLMRLLAGLHVEQAFVYITAVCVFVFLTGCFFATAQGLDESTAMLRQASLSGGRDGADRSPYEELRGRYGLSDREFEILDLFGRGYSKRRIGESLCLSENTVRWYLQQLYARLGIHSRDELIGLIDGSREGGTVSD